MTELVEGAERRLPPPANHSAGVGSFGLRPGLPKPLPAPWKCGRCSSSSWWRRGPNRLWICATCCPPHVEAEGIETWEGRS